MSRIVPFDALRRAWCLGFLLVVFAVGDSAFGLQIEFDYTYDTNGFFADPQRRELMELAARHVNRYVDPLKAIFPSDENSWFTFPPLPPSGADTLLRDMVIPEDTMKVIVGGNSILPVATLSQSNAAPASLWTGTPEWERLLASRGQPGTLDTPPTDFANWGGVTMFNGDDIAWYFGETTDGLDPEETDFLTVAIHELMHILGFGPAASFQAQTDLSEFKFTGSEALAVRSATNPDLKLFDGGHWENFTTSFAGGKDQKALMNGVIDEGVRRYPTLLDRAAMRDVGWEEARPGDVNLDREFDNRDIVTVLQAGRYRNGTTAPWADGDWNDDLVFDQRDVIVALSAGTYLTGVYAAVGPEGLTEGGTATVLYNAATGEIAVDAPDGAQLTSISIDSAAGIFTGDAALHVGGSFDVDEDETIFKATFNGSFDSISFGKVAATGLEESFLLSDLSVSGSLAGGGSLGEMQLVYVPEPTAMTLVTVGLFCLLAARARAARCSVLSVSSRSTSSPDEFRNRKAHQATAWCRGDRHGKDCRSGHGARR